LLYREKEATYEKQAHLSRGSSGGSCNARVPDLPGVLVWVTPQEREFIKEGGHGQFADTVSDN
jgi:hypothetical protein